MSDLNLSQALDLIRILRQQLEELELTSKEYESQLEQVVEELKDELYKKDDTNDLTKINTKVVSLEVQVDELENENRGLKLEVSRLNQENDKLFEQTILLRHEVHDMKKILSRTGIQHLTSPYISSYDNIKVSTFGPTLKLSSSRDDNKMITTVNPATVLATTNNKNR